MTKDIGKLAGLKLWKPKLVVIKEQPIEKTDGMQEVWTTEELEEKDVHKIPDEIFSVPSMLSEHYVPVREVEYKPLYLVQLLKTKNIISGTLIFTKSNEGAARLALTLFLVGWTYQLLIMLSTMIYPLQHGRMYIVGAELLELVNLVLCGLWSPLTKLGGSGRISAGT